MVIDDELGVPVEAQEAEERAARRVVGGNEMMTAGDIRKQFVNLHLCHFHIADFGIQKAGAMLAGGFEDVQHGLLVEPGQPDNGVDAEAFKHHGDDLRGLVRLDADTLQRLLFGKRPAATQTLEALHGEVLVGVKSPALDFI